MTEFSFPLRMFTLLLHQFCHETRPTGLMTCTDPCAVVPVKVFMEWDVIAPVWVVLEGFIAPEDGAASVRIA